MKLHMPWIAGAGIFLLTASVPLRARSSDTARVGTVQYIEGSVALNGRALSASKDQYPVLAPGDTLSTSQGHAEVLLTPGVFLRLGHDSRVRLINDSLTDTRLRLELGAAILEADNVHKDNNLRLEFGPATARVLEDGLYRFQSDPAAGWVFKGSMDVTADDSHARAKKHHEVSWNDRLVNAKFSPKKEDDELSRWSRLRSEYEAEASIASAQYVFDMGWGWGYPGWFWNPWFNAWTWFPVRGWYLNPYGFSFWSPVAVYRVFPHRYYGVDHVRFTPRLGTVSPSGLNIERRAVAREAARGYVPHFSSGPSPGMGSRRGFRWPAHAPAMRAGGTRHR